LRELKEAREATAVMQTNLINHRCIAPRRYREALFPEVCHSTFIVADEFLMAEGKNINENNGIAVV
jgi:hypothetical protein